MSTHPTVAADQNHDQDLKNPDGSWKHTNALVDQTSPYLLQHAHNPVDWHPWGKAAFELARESGKPIFLSVGYSTCYWCHVMERQVFENPQLAAMLNEHFINVKVDREERPDVDDIYMTAVQMMTQHGGWPMSVFLTPPGAAGQDDPGLKPFWAGTYIPPQPRHGMPGMPQVIEALTDAWKNERQKVIAQADHVARVVADHLAQKQAGDPDPPTATLVQAAANQILRTYDPQHGGFGGPPKFPQPTYLLFLLKIHENNPNQEVWRALRHTLEQMARGGMYDQVGGGFHRYSTDGQWLVPHFEKMLYDNAQLVEAYLAAHQVQRSQRDPADPGDPMLLSRVVRETCDYVLREMTDPSPAHASETRDQDGTDHPTGTFYSAQDAEVNAREGLNYLWTAQQVAGAIDDEELTQLATVMYGLDRGTNFQDPHHPEDPRANVLYLPQRLDELARDRGQSLEQITRARKEINRKLLEARSKRKQPITDDKTLVCWNGMMIAALAQAGRVLDEPRYTQAAQRAANTILTHMSRDDGGLYRTMRRGRAKIPAFLEDYAFFVHGLLELHRSTHQRRWLGAAIELTQHATENFSARDDRSGGYYDTLADQADLFVRTVSVYDGAVPSGNSQMVHNLIDLYELTQNEAYLDQAVADLHAFAAALRRFGQGMSHMHHALLRAMEIAPDRFVASAQPPKPDDAEPGRRPVVSVHVRPEQIDLSHGQARVIVTLDIGPGYHLNTHNPGAAGVIPTSLELRDSPGVSLHTRYPPGHERSYPFADQPIRVYEGKVELIATLSTTDAAVDDPRGGAPTLWLRYQVCTDNSCLEPKQIQLPVEIVNTRRSK